MRIWVQITAGRGPAECALTVSQVLRCLLNEAVDHGVRAEVLEAVPGRFSGTLNSVLLALEGAHVRVLLGGWFGTIQWIGQSPFRPEYKRKNWFVGVEEIAVPENPGWSESDLQFDTLRASGPGGQHVNKTETAVRVTHLPTGIAVMARAERSQSANRKLALARLAEQLDGRGRENERGARRQRWSQHNALERGNPVRVYEGSDFQLRRARHDA